MIGPGKYDKDTENIIQRDGAQAVIIIVAGGVRGCGFSASFTPEFVGDGMQNMASVLRTVADQIEEDLKQLAKQ